MGTKSVYTKEFLEKIEELAGLGYPYRRIEQSLGLPKDSLRVRKAEAKKSGDYTIYNTFTRAREAFVKKHLENIDNWAVEKDWRAAKWLLAITEPENFSEKKRLELGGKDGQPIQMKIVHYGKKEK